MMSAFECYKEYVALKNHFTRPSYDYHKYNGKTRSSLQSFETRKDKLYFMKVAKHVDPINYILSNLVENPKIWIKEIAFSPASEEVYKNWLKRQQSLSYTFKTELSKLNSEFNTNFICEDNKHPILLKLYLGKDISLETLCLLLELSRAKKHWDSKMQYDLVWEDTRTKVEKYMPFIKVDKDKIKNIVLDYFSE